MSETSGKVEQLLLEITQTSKAHCILRAKERYNLDLTDQIAKEMVNKIKRGRAFFVKEHYKNSSEVYIVDYRGREYKVAYHPMFEILVTFLPRHRPKRPPTVYEQSTTFAVARKVKNDRKAKR